MMGLKTKEGEKIGGKGGKPRRIGKMKKVRQRIRIYDDEGGDKREGE